jgi:hypothetical protein
LMDSECVFRGCVNEYFIFSNIGAAGSHGPFVCPNTRFAK